MVRVAIAGIGNCASALVQGVTWYQQEQVEPIGTLKEITEVGLSDLEFVLGFDVNKNKVNRDLSKAIFVPPNCANIIHPRFQLGAPVLRGPVLDGLDSAIAVHIPVDKKQKGVSVETKLRDYEVDVLVITLPTGAQKAAEHYAKAAIKAGCAIVNGMPASIANNPEIVELTRQYNVPIIGDDIKSQVGATIVHRALTHLFPLRGAVLDRTIQLDWGGDMDFCNLMSNGRYELGKRQGKTEAVIADQPNGAAIDVQISAVDYIPFLNNQKEAYMRLEGRVFGHQPVRIDITMQVQDGYNSAGMLVDAIRVGSIARRRGYGGVLREASAYFNKRPPEQMSDDVAKEALVRYLTPHANFV